MKLLHLLPIRKLFSNKILEKKNLLKTFFENTFFIEKISAYLHRIFVEHSAVRGAVLDIHGSISSLLGERRPLKGGPRMKVV